MSYFLIAALAFIAGVFGGLSGYGSGLILPPFLLPLVGPEPIVPIITIAALSINASRAFAFRESVDWRKAMIVIPCALPTCLVGAFLYSNLTGPAVTALIGCTLLVLVPIRRLAGRAQLHLSTAGLVLSAVVYGLIVGSTAGSGVVLITIMLATGISGVAVVATDSVISIVLGFFKLAVFQGTGSLDTQIWLMAALIGACATPGAFVAKRILARVPIHIHTALLDGVVMFGGGALIAHAILGA